ncbi:alpha amylase C-terminal domain-containing protein [Aestuariibacter halophilus]|uniref:Alpha amylase C-terminal domain-containing protein n=1 Tax=Fluctibacter halophilus TaxID=226011 RepID=A0ABS8G5V5_9ALTE|nr:alpha-amylase family glycosyl hydrolase [Aestuariibacter halophilus]MCC2615491.1 alpha amylase C-terminal domain-containing protein [Aestuariibacter halophilus]
MKSLRSACSVATVVLMIATLTGCQTHHINKPAHAATSYDYVELAHPEWAKNATIYQINTRQFTAEGTFAAAQQQLPRLKALGVDILWLMPVHPIGEENRKGTLGSPYAVKDYFGVNPEFGTLADLKAFVDAAHQLGMYVILDWVANHTAWDNVMRFEHPEWYERDHEGNFRPTPWWDWSDIIDLDYSNADMRDYMKKAMRYWVEEVGVDGYRCDVAGFVPVAFWNEVRAELDSVKPVFMLAEWESRDLHAKAFDMTYGWSWQEAVHDVLSGHGGLNPLYVYYSWNESAYPKDAYRMTFVTNHDMNAWEGTVFERYGSREKVETAIVLSVVGEGMPLIYNGLEAGNDRRLAFFERDPIAWKPHPFGDLYKRLFALMKQNTALWHGKHGATMQRVVNDKPNSVFSFVRQNDNDKVVVMINFSDHQHAVSFDSSLLHGTYREFNSPDMVTLTESSQLTLGPWEYRIYIKP